jgi:hypothetical protein
MTAIEGSTVSCRTMVDGSLRLVLEFEPAMSQPAFALFGAPGRGVAVAALKDGRGYIEADPLPRPPEPPEPPPGPKRSESQKTAWDSMGRNCKAAVTIGSSPEFWHFAKVTNSQDAGEWIKRMAKVASRKDLDEPDAAHRFRVCVLLPYQRWQARVHDARAH